MSATCKDCGVTDLPSTYNGMCFQCFAAAQAAWSRKMAVRQDPAQFSLSKLLRLMLPQHWMHECEIVPAYMPPHPNKDTRPRCVVRYRRENGNETFLRSGGEAWPVLFWDVYGDDFRQPEMALLAIARAPAPSHVSVVPTHGD